jgi:hypothetical protein
VHAVCALEVRLCVGDELTVGRVIDGFDPDDFWAERVIVLVNVFQKFELGRGRPDDEHLITAFERACHFMEEVLRFLGVIVCAFRPPRVLVVDVMGREDHVFVDLVRVNLEDVGFFVIDPDGNVFGHGQVYLCTKRAATAPRRGCDQSRQYTGRP